MDDLAVPQHHRSGAHRARRHPLLVALATVVTVAVASAVLLWGLLAFDVLGVGDGSLDAGGAPAAGASAEPSGQPSDEPPAEPSTRPSEEPSAERSELPAEQSPSGTGTEPVDRGLPLAVLNATTTAGLASDAAEELTSAGWTVETVGNYDGGQTPTTVLYAAESQRPTAEALAGELGEAEVSPSDEVDVLTVVLGPDYPG